MAHAVNMCGLVAEFEDPAVVVEAIHRTREEATN